jgi:hypothetical protein
MTSSRRKLWQTVQIATICGIAVSPFWIMASDLSDGSEAMATAIGAGLVATVTVVLKYLLPVITREKPYNRDDSPSQDSSIESRDSSILPGEK